MPNTLSDLLTRYAHLPASAIAGKLNEALSRDGAAVVTAPPGAGKSTLLPLAMLLGEPSSEGRILMLEPRRLAARQIAERMAAMLGEPVGQTVGYRVRFESRTSAATRIEVLTEGILTRMLIDDATLEGVRAVVFDEFHERSIHSDLALALTRRSREIIRPDLQLVVMSATIDADGICQALQAPLIESNGRMFPVETIHADEDADRLHPAPMTADAIRQMHATHKGDILVFLPGQADIEQCIQALGSSLGETHVMPLYGNLPPERQRQAIAPTAEGERKVVVATPIAETSLTIEGVRIVVDAGFQRKLAFDARTGLSHLETVRISHDMATQRAGRAGRVAEGVCLRLWTMATHLQMEPQRHPEIEEADLSPLLLSTAAFGETDVRELPWLTPPPAAHVAQATSLLQMLGAVGTDGTITRLGKRMAQLPCHPRMARMMLQADTPKLKALACDIAALLEEKDPMGDSPDTDLSLRISRLRHLRKERNLGRWSRIAQIAAEYRRMAHAPEDNADIVPHDAGMLIAFAYPERIAQSTDSIGTFRLSGGNEVRLETSDAMSACEWLAIASLTSSARSGRVFLSAPLDPSDLEHPVATDGAARIITERDNVGWDSRKLCVVMQHERRIGKLLLDCRPIHDADAQQVASIICEAAAKDGLSMFSWTEEVERLQRRVAQVAEWHSELHLPDVSTPHLLATAHEWLPLYLTDGGRMRTSATELKRMDLTEAIWNTIPYPLQQEIDRLAPTHIAVPTGSRIRVDYRSGAQAPVLSVRLQECFGLQQTPCVDDGKRPVLMELLSPGFKPVQLTQDLASFWESTYFEVRKELRRRYPKHYWPENPLEAEAVRGVKRK